MRSKYFIGEAYFISQIFHSPSGEFHWKNHFRRSGFFWCRRWGSRGKPLAFASQITPIICPSCSAKANRTRWTRGCRNVLRCIDVIKMKYCFAIWNPSKLGWNLRFRLRWNKIRQNICEANISYALAYFITKWFHSPTGEFHWKNHFRRSGFFWWRRWGSNRWPLDCQSNALPN